ncbi:MAG TPA: cytochrome c [Niastella sp.]|nr:cytochrome c [Niastella sp.]
MKNIFIIAGIAAIGFGVTGCGGAEGNDPGRIYMPDMAYSRAYEAYGYNTTFKDYDALAKRGINYNGLPVMGTMARGDVPSYPLPASDSGYAQAVSFKNPNETVTLTAVQRKEAERLYLVNCAICHGTALDGNGPLWKGGDGPFPAAPRNLKDDYSKKLADGQMYHVIMYGKGQMGSYASQVHPEARWWIIKYIREKQGTGGVASAAADSTQTGGIPGSTGSGSSSGTAGSSAATGSTTTSMQK